MDYSFLQAIDDQFNQIAEADDNWFDDSYDADAAYALHLWQRELTDAKTRIQPQSSPFSIPTLVPVKRLRDPDDEPASITKRRRPTETGTCAACFEEAPLEEMFDVECCGTTYHETCFKNWFATLLNSKQIPKCCGGDFDVDSLEGMLSARTRKNYADLKAEFDADRKVYCQYAKCGAFIQTEAFTEHFAPCRKCRRSICTSCGMGTKDHVGKNKVCPEAFEDDNLNAIITQQKWKRCPRCHAIVEKADGCDSIQCTCGQMFCYVCGGKKKAETDSCRCGDSDDNEGEYENNDGDNDRGNAGGDVTHPHRTTAGTSRIHRIGGGLRLFGQGSR